MKLIEEEVIVKKAISLMKDNKNIYIWCKGNTGKWLAELFDKNGIRYEGFIDNDFENNAIRFSDILDKSKVFIFIATITYIYIEEIKEEILKGGLHTEDFMAISVNDNNKVSKCFCVENSLFIKNDGWIYPCCRLWNISSYRIGHISDENISDKIAQYKKKCCCAIAEFENPKKKKMKLHSINIEFSLACQGKCIPCCVEAPFRSDIHKYEYFEELRKLIIDNEVEQLVVQGGEVFIQKDTVEFLEKIKTALPDLKLAIITNGCFDECEAEQFSKIFNTVNISFMGIQKETYECIMGLKLDKTVRFMDRLSELGHTVNSISFVILPNTIHESARFIEFAMEHHIQHVVFNDGNPLSYVLKDTQDRYWNRVIERTSKKFKQTLLKLKVNMVEEGVAVAIAKNTADLLSITPEFLNDNDLNQIVKYN